MTQSPYYEIQKIIAQKRVVPQTLRDKILEAGKELDYDLRTFAETNRVLLGKLLTAMKDQDFLSADEIVFENQAGELQRGLELLTNIAKGNPPQFLNKEHLSDLTAFPDRLTLFADNFSAKKVAESERERLIENFVGCLDSLGNYERAINAASPSKFNKHIDFDDFAKLYETWLEQHYEVLNNVLNEVSNRHTDARETEEYTKAIKFINNTLLNPMSWANVPEDIMVSKYALNAVLKNKMVKGDFKPHQLRDQLREGYKLVSGNPGIRLDLAGAINEFDQIVRREMEFLVSQMKQKHAAIGSPSP